MVVNWQNVLLKKEDWGKRPSQRTSLNPQYLNKETVEEMIKEVDAIRKATLQSHEYDREALAELLTKIVKNLHVLKTDVKVLEEFKEFVL